MHTQIKTFGFVKKESLKSDKLIDQLFKQGKSKQYGCIRMVFIMNDLSGVNDPQVMFSVPKKTFKRAVKRNLLKRRMKESYRLNKSALIMHLKENKINLNVAFLFVENTIITFGEIEKSINFLLKFLISKTQMSPTKTQID